jgi:hypothetical protein
MSTNYSYDPAKLHIVSGVIQLVLPNTLGTLVFDDIYNSVSFTSLGATIIAGGSDGIGFQIYLNGSLVYYNGSAWVASNGSYAQSSTVAQINAGAASLVVSSPSTIELQAVFSGSGSTTPELANVTVNYINAGPFAPIVAGSCNVYCYLEDILGNQLTIAGNAPQLIAVNDYHFVNNDSFVARFYKTVNFYEDAAGPAAVIPLVITANSGNKIRFMITYQPDGDPSRVETIRINPCVIPNQNSADLTTIAAVDQSQVL